MCKGLLCANRKGISISKQLLLLILGHFYELKPNYWLTSILTENFSPARTGTTLPYILLRTSGAAVDLKVINISFQNGRKSSQELYAEFNMNMGGHALIHLGRRKSEGCRLCPFQYRNKRLSALISSHPQ